MSGNPTPRRSGRRAIVSGRPTRSAGETGAFATGVWLTQERPRYSLSLKFALPVSLLAFLVAGAMCVVARHCLYESLLNEVKKNGVTSVTLLTRIGRRMLDDQERFVARGRAARESDPALYAFVAANPDSEEPLLPAGRHWLAECGYVPPAKWARLCGVAGPDELISPAQALMARNDAKLLEFMLHYGDVRERNEVLAAYVRTPAPDNIQIASSHVMNAGLLVSREDWIGDGGKSLGLVRVDGPDMVLRHVEIYAARLRSGGEDPAGAAAAREVLMFRMPILRDPGDAGPDSLMGAAVVGYRADLILSERRTLSRMMWAFTGGLVVLAGAVSLLIGRWVASPLRRLVHDMAEVAKGHFNHTCPVDSDDEVGLAARAFNQMTRRLAAAQAREREAVRIENELATASAIQKTLLPARLPELPGFDIAAFYRPAREVGGDYYDFFPIGGNLLGVVVADVSGKSIPGALVMSTTRTILRFLAPGNQDAATVLEKANAVIAGEIKRGMFVTAYYAIVDTAARKMLCASAGHNPLVLARADGRIETINPGGIALGFDKGPVFKRTLREREVELRPGDRVVLYTDGVVEARNPRDDEYGDEHFRDFVARHRAAASRDFVEALVGDIDGFVDGAEASDDITIVTFKVE